MMQETSGVELRALLREAFIRLGDEHVSQSERVEATVRAGPIQRSAEDRSRTRQLVIEELARRRDQAAAGVKLAMADPAPASTSSHQPLASLFAGLDDCKVPAASSHQCRVRVSRPRICRGTATDIRELVTTAYRSLMRRLPEDHVVLNPMANAEFIVRCRELGTTAPDVLLNRTLLNNRKANRHSCILREPVPGLDCGVYDQIGHAVEIAASLVQRESYATGRDLPSVDDILCAPELRQTFKTYVTALSVNADIANCLLVLLAYRKSGPESAQRLASVDVPDPLLTAPLQSLDLADVPDKCGVYRVLCKRQPIFVSGTANLRQRLWRHITAEKERFLPTCLPYAVDGPVSVQVFAGPTEWLPRRMDAIARNMRIDKYPGLNWREKSALFAERDHIVSRCAAVG